MIGKDNKQPTTVSAKAHQHKLSATSRDVQPMCPPINFINGTQLIRPYILSSSYSSYTLSSTFSIKPSIVFL